MSVTAADIPAVAAYLICFVSVGIYAQRRLNTPQTNRSSTRMGLYRQAVLGYVACTMILFIVLSSALQYAAMNRLLLLLNLGDIPELQSVAALPAPLIATVLLTVWLPNVYLVRDVDGWLLDAFKARANIPREVRDRAERLIPHSLQVTAADLPEIRLLIQDEGLPEELSGHLRGVRGNGLELSRYRLTRVLKLFDVVRGLDRDAECQRFFADYQNEWKNARVEFRSFCEQAAATLEKGRKLQEKVSPTEYESLVAEKRENFAESAARMFGQLALLAAGAVLCKEATEHGIGERLRAIGFAIDDAPEQPEFPMRSLAGLALLLLFYLVATDILLHKLNLVPEHPDLRSPVPASARPLLIVTNYAVTVGFTVWLIGRYPRLQRAAGGGLRWDVYGLCWLIGAGIVTLIWVGLFLLRYGAIPAEQMDWNRLFAIAILVGSLSGAVACCVDIGGGRWPESVLLQLAEGAGCAAFTALVTALLLMKISLPFSADMANSGLTTAIFVLFPASVAFIVGSLVPHICRSERALARWRSGPGAPSAPTASLPLQLAGVPRAAD